MSDRPLPIPCSQIYNTWNFKKILGRHVVYGLYDRSIVVVGDINGLDEMHAITKMGRIWWVYPPDR